MTREQFEPYIRRPIFISIGCECENVDFRFWWTASNSQSAKDRNPIPKHRKISIKKKENEMNRRKECKYCVSSATEKGKSSEATRENRITETFFFFVPFICYLLESTVQNSMCMFMITRLFIQGISASIYSTCVLVDEHFTQ